MLLRVLGNTPARGQSTQVKPTLVSPQGRARNDQEPVMETGVTEGGNWSLGELAVMPRLSQVALWALTGHSRFISGYDFSY